MFSINPHLEDLIPVKEQRYFVVDTQDIFDTLHQQIQQAGEISAVDFGDDEEINLFMMDIMSNLAYLPKAFNAGIIDVVLQDAATYLTCNFSPLQSYLWRTAASELVKRFYAYNMYDVTTAVHRYDFDSMLGNNLLMRLYD